MSPKEQTAFQLGLSLADYEAYERDMEELAQAETLEEFELDQWTESQEWLSTQTLPEAPL